MRGKDAVIDHNFIERQERSSSAKTSRIIRRSFDRLNGIMPDGARDCVGNRGGSCSSSPVNSVPSTTLYIHFTYAGGV